MIVDVHGEAIGDLLGEAETSHQFDEVPYFWRGWSSGAPNIPNWSSMAMKRCSEAQEYCVLARLSQRRWTIARWMMKISRCSRSGLNPRVLVWDVSVRILERRETSSFQNLKKVFLSRSRRNGIIILQGEGACVRSGRVTSQRIGVRSSSKDVGVIFCSEPVLCRFCFVPRRVIPWTTTSWQ